MKRRNFIINSGLCAVAVSASSFIKFDGTHYVGDCETTSDILGPFYRPNSPIRTNLVSSGEKGTLVELSGKIKHLDCTTPYRNAKIEIWHCDADGVYDNETDAFRFRGTAFSDDNGNYAFQTIVPVPYDAGGGLMRPAHFHLMITAEGYQPLVTQLYLAGDQHISEDPSSASDKAKRRILPVQNLKDGHKKIEYDVSMALTLGVEAVAIDKLIGTYSNVKDGKDKIELFKKDNDLWLKNEVFGEGYRYVGNNTFECPGEPDGSHASLTFDLKLTGEILLTTKANWGTLDSPRMVYSKD